MIYRDFIENDIVIFGLYGAVGGLCDCGDAECKAVLKHPIASNWQHSPLWSDEQLEVMEEMGQLETGYGVLTDGLLVIDVDERNGGAKSYDALLEAVPQIAGAGLVVKTGSGGLSKHLYFSLEDAVALVQNLKDYPGIDFKSTGYVVGPGSLHESGNRYKVLAGSPFDIEKAPAALLDLLKKPDRHRASVNGVSVDVSDDDLKGMLAAIPNLTDTDYETYIRIGMAIHLVTSGEGYSLWADWASKGDKYDPKDMGKKWHSFGKSANPVTFGTLAHYAEEAGWVAPVDFSSELQFDAPEACGLETKGIDLLRPPGFVGKITKWINDRNRHPREHLAVAAALASISSVAGMRYVDPLDGITPNLFLFGVSGSATGKESVLKSYQEILKAAGVVAAAHGAFKSEQEIYRNLTRHQAALYTIDELGETLGKIANARAKGTAAYLEGIIGTLMSLYSKANSFAMITGDLKEEIRQALTKDLSGVQKRVDGNEPFDGDEMKLESLKRQVGNIDKGIEKPYLCIFGLTTPERFSDLMDFDMATNGFMGRSLIFREREDNPKSKPRNKIQKEPIPNDMAAALMQLYAPGHSELFERVECVGEQVDVPTRDDAKEKLDEIEHAFYEMAEKAKNQTGLTAIPRRGYEQVAKVSMILAIPGGLRTVEHVMWAYALVKRDVDEKMKLAYSNSATDKQDALASMVMSHVTDEHGETIGRLRSKCRSYRKEDVDKVVDKLVENSFLRFEETSAGKGRTTKKYFAVSV